MNLVPNLIAKAQAAPRAGVCGTSSIRLPCIYYLFLAVVVVRYETTATARWALLFIVGDFQRHHHRCSLTGFHVRLMGMLPCPRDYIRSCFADATLTAGFALISGSAES
jgi:hypothetical protein